MQKEIRKDSRLLVNPYHKEHNSAQPEHLVSVHNSMELQPLETSAREVDLEIPAMYPSVIVRDGSFGWHKIGPGTVQGIELQFSGPSLNIVVGPVGCGKSTLIKGLLGETLSMTGSLSVRSLESAFCDQIPWIRRGTIRENIIGHLEFDELWYKSVVYACALDVDFGQLPDGDQTTVGSKGMTLSGGQKQRLVSAHNLYLDHS